MLMIWNTLYKYIIEPLLVIVTIIIGLISLAKKKIINIYRNYKNSQILFICFLLSLVYRTSFKFIFNKFGFELLIAIFFVSIISTLFKITIVISKGQKCTLDLVITKFTSSLGFSLISVYVYTLINIYII